MTQIMHVVNEAALIELGLRMGWIKPTPISVRTPKGEIWRMYGEILGRRNTRTRNGIIPTDEFLAICRTCTHKTLWVESFGGVLPEVEQEMLKWSKPFGVKLSYRSKTGKVKERAYYWKFNPGMGMWEFRPKDTLEGCVQANRKLAIDVLGIHHWVARTKEEVLELGSTILERIKVVSTYTNAKLVKC